MHWNSMKLLRLGPGYKDRPSGAAWGRFEPTEYGRVGPSRAG